MEEHKLDHKILVVDNESLVVEELVEFLMGHGYECVGAASPGEALAMFRGKPDIDLVLSDFRMQEMNGVQLVEALRASDPGRLFEAVIFTGNAEKNDVIDALRVGVADYFQKPLDLNLLLESIAKILAKLEKYSAEVKMHTLSQNFRVLLDSFNSLYGDMDAVQGSDTSAVAPGKSQADFSEKLSPRQQDVALLIAKGLTNYQIACDLGISENTVKIYVSQVLRIFKLNNRTQLALTLEGARESM